MKKPISMCASDGCVTTLAQPWTGSDLCTWCKRDPEKVRAHVQRPAADVAKQELTFAEASVLLGECHCDECVDRTFGDAEVNWWLNNKEVGIGYFGSSGDSVSLLQTEGYLATTFHGSQAKALRGRSRSRKYSSNNEY